MGYQDYGVFWPALISSNINILLKLLQIVKLWVENIGNESNFESIYKSVKKCLTFNMVECILNI